MTWITTYYRILTTVSILLGITVVLDTFIFKQFLKNLMASANSSSISPYTSDGVLNISVIFALVGAFPIAYFLLDRWHKKKVKVNK